MARYKYLPYLTLTLTLTLTLALALTLTLTHALTLTSLAEAYFGHFCMIIHLEFLQACTAHMHAH